MTPAPRKLPRSPAQVAASKLNGRLGGPKTDAGRAVSRMNALRTGLYADATVVPGDDHDRIREIVEGWMGSLGVSSFAAAELARRAAHLAVSTERAERLREKVLAEVLEERTADSEANHALVGARDTREALAGLLDLAEGVHEPVAHDRAEKLVAPVQRVVQGVLDLKLPAGVAYPFAAAAGALNSEDIADVPVEVFASLARASRSVLDAIDDALPALRLDVEKERERQTEMLLVVDDPRLRQIDKVRGRLLKELDGLLRALRSLKELEGGSGSTPAAPPVPVVVEFKSIGGAVR